MVGKAWARRGQGVLRQRRWGTSCVVEFHGEMGHGSRALVRRHWNISMQASGKGETNPRRGFEGRQIPDLRFSTEGKGSS